MRALGAVMRGQLNRSAVANEPYSPLHVICGTMPRMNRSDLELLQIHIEALFVHDEDGRIRSVNEPDGDRAPRFFLGSTRQGNLWRFRYDVPEQVVRRLVDLAASEPTRYDLRLAPRTLQVFHLALGNDPSSEPAYFGPAYHFPDAWPTPVGVTRITRSNLDVLQPMVTDLDHIRRTFEAREPVWAVVQNGSAVSLCYSSRLTDRAAEAGVETLETYRGHGYASAVVAAWAHAVRATGRIPLYGTTWDNHASQGVARKLGLIEYGADLCL